MPPRSRLIPGSLVAFLALLVIIPGPAFLQVAPVDCAAKYPGIEGLYEVRLPGGKTTVMQVYFKDGALRTVDSGDATSTKFDPVDGAALRFARTSSDKGEFLLEFLADGEGRFTKFRVVNASQKLDVTGTKSAAFDDAKADPASPSDCRGYFERHYRKTEAMVPMRDGVRLYTQVYSPIDRSERHPVILVRTPYGLSPYGPEFTGFTMPSLLFLKEGYIIVFQELRGTLKSEGTFVYFRPSNGDKTTPADVDESGDIFRGKFRTSFEKPEPFVPGRVAKVAFELPDVQHAFRKGHRIMVQVQSSWFPLFDRNPQTFCDIRAAEEKDFKKATHRLHRTEEDPSHIEFRVIKKDL